MTTVDRIFKAIDRNGTDREFELKPPTIAAENEGDRHYRIAFSKALAEGVYPREKLREVMRGHEMWTEKDEKELKIEVGKIAILQVELKTAQADGDDDKCIELARKISDARKRMWELFLVQQSVYMNSAEGVAEMVKTEAIMAACTTIKATGDRYWTDYSEYVRERDLNTRSTVYSHLIELQSKLLDSIRQDLTDDYPEKQYLKEAQERMLDREIEEEVANQLRERADKAIAKDKEKKTTRKVAKKSGKRVASKTTKARKSSRRSSQS